MDRKFGVVMEDELARRVEKPLGYGDSRSERIRELIRVGLAVEQAYAEVEMSYPDADDMADDVSQLIHDVWGPEE